MIADSGGLAGHYEDLREDQMAGDANAARGRALLIFKGMVAWMRGMRDSAPSNPPPVALGSESRLPAGIEQNLISLVATMALHNGLEASHAE